MATTFMSILVVHYVKFIMLSVLIGDRWSTRYFLHFCLVERKGKRYLCLLQADTTLKNEATGVSIIDHTNVI